MQEIDDDIRPLSLIQQQFLQRIISSKILTNTEARALYASIIESSNINSNESFEKCISTINKSLTKAFKLEIKTISLDGKLYHCVINKKSDKISEKNGCIGLSNMTPHALAFLKLILSKMFQSKLGSNIDEEDDDEDDNDGSMTEIDLINLKQELPDQHKKKINLEDAELAIHTFKREKLLVYIRKKSSNEKRLTIGPKVYMELSDFVKNFIGENDMPQLVIY